MSRAQAGVRRPYVAEGPYPLFIGGRAVHIDDHFEATDPSTGQPWARLGHARPQHVAEAVAAARDAARGWSVSGPSERQMVLDAIADRLQEDGDLPALLATENGRPIREARSADVPTAVALFRYYAGLARALNGDHVPTDDPELRVWTLRRPVGVVAALIPWNSPLISTALKVAPALATGNTVVLKPSELASTSVVEFGMRTADLLPPGTVNIVTGYGPEAGATLVAHPGIDKISFTGGLPTARRILRAAADHVTPALMELGGKSAFIICDDADLELAVEDALKGIVFQNGQVCFAASRLYVHERVRDEFVERFVERMRRVRIGDAVDPETQMGPLVSREHRDRVLGHIANARSEGVRLLTGGAPLVLGDELSGGWFVEPTVMEDPTGASSIVREEVFGPVTVVTTWSDERDVIRRANDSEFGLAAGVWTTDLARAHRVADALEAGTIWINTWFDVAPGQPLGGIKNSGHGRESTAETLLEYTTAKAVAMRLSPSRPKLWG